MTSSKITLTLPGTYLLSFCILYKNYLIVILVVHLSCFVLLQSHPTVSHIIALSIQPSVRQMKVAGPFPEQYGVMRVMDVSMRSMVVSIFSSILIMFKLIMIIYEK